MTLRLLALAALLCSLPSLAAPAKAPASASTKDLAKWPPRPFSGEMVITSKEEADSPPVRQKVFFSRGRMRMEMSMGGQTRAVVTDLVKKQAYMLMPQQKMAMDMSAAMATARNQGPTHEQLAAAGGDLCALSGEGRTCKKLGSEKMNGRAATKWQMTEKDGRKSTVWMDDALMVMLRHESDQGTVDLQNIQEGPQPDSLFVVPAGFQVMKHPAGMPGQSGAPKK